MNDSYKEMLQISTTEVKPYIVEQDGTNIMYGK
jgi:hypothetical protein